MRNTVKLAWILAALAISPSQGRSAEAYQEHYTETKNPVRVFDWDTLKLLVTTKVPLARIDANSPDELVAQLKQSLRGVKGADALQFSFKRELWQGTAGKIDIRVDLNIQEEIDLIELIRFVSELGGLTFSVKMGKIEFRPLVG